MRQWFNLSLQGKNFGHCLRKCGKWQYDARAPDPDAASLTNPKYGQPIGFVDPKLSLEIGELNSLIYLWLDQDVMVACYFH